MVRPVIHRARVILNRTITAKLSKHSKLKTQLVTEMGFASAGIKHHQNPVQMTVFIYFMSTLFQNDSPHRRI